MSARQHAFSQPQGRSRARPGTSGRGRFYRVVVRPKSEFKAFRLHDVGKPGHIDRLAGRRSSGNWSTQAWLISKSDAHREHGRLMADTADERKILGALGSAPHHKAGDVFTARDRPNIPERVKPTLAQRRAQRKNIRKAQMA